MSDGQINDQSCEVRRIRSPGGQWRSWLLELYVRSPPSQSEEKTQQQNFCRLRRQTALWYTLDEEKRTEREVRNCPLKRVRSRSHDGLICTGETYKSAVKLTFSKGASLKDPSGLFNSSLEGNARRAIDIHEGDGIDEDAFKTLIRAAAALNRSSAR